jgi:putative flippase GtrA
MIPSFVLYSSLSNDNSLNPDQPTGLGLNRVPLDTGPLLRLVRRHGGFRMAKFGMAAGTGFLVYESLLTLGILAVYHVFAVPSFIHSSLIVLGLDALALGIGDTVAFLINERVTVRTKAQKKKRSKISWFKRWSSYQGIAFMGNLGIAGVQLALLAGISLFPAFGGIVGAMLSYPVTYALSMHFVWGVNPFRA